MVGRTSKSNPRVWRERAPMERGRQISGCVLVKTMEALLRAVRNAVQSWFCLFFGGLAFFLSAAGI